MDAAPGSADYLAILLASTRLLDTFSLGLRPQRVSLGAQVWGLVVKVVVFALTGLMAVGVVIVAGAARAGDDFPLTGNYTQNVPCKGDGSDPHDVQVKISPQEIDSQVGVCTFLDTKRDGSSVSAHVECAFPGGPLIGDVTFTVRPDKTVELVDRDKNYDAVLYRCP